MFAFNRAKPTLSRRSRNDCFGGDLNRINGENATGSETKAPNEPGVKTLLNASHPPSPQVKPAGMAMMVAQTGLRVTGAEDVGVLIGVVMTAEAMTEVAEEAHPPVWGKFGHPRRYYSTLRIFFF